MVRVSQKQGTRIPVRSGRRPRSQSESGTISISKQSVLDHATSLRKLRSQSVSCADSAGLFTAGGRFRPDAAPTRKRKSLVFHYNIFIFIYYILQCPILRQKYHV